MFVWLVVKCCLVGRLVACVFDFWLVGWLAAELADGLAGLDAWFCFAGLACLFVVGWLVVWLCVSGFAHWFAGWLADGWFLVG